MKTYQHLYVTDLARNDMKDAMSFYENQNPNLGMYFRDSIISDIEALLFYAGIHAKHFGHYRMLAKRFPFSIYYCIESEKVVVHAIMDDRRDPKLHKQRLSH